jgi:hypothetical protein
LTLAYVTKSRCISWAIFIFSLANQEVILFIGLLGKLGRFESTAEFFFVYIALISLASEPILSMTSLYTKILSPKGLLEKVREK